MNKKSILQKELNSIFLLASIVATACTLTLTIATFENLYLDLASFAVCSIVMAIPSTVLFLALES